MRVIDLKVHQKVVNFVPMQLGPIAIASDPARDRVLVLNYLSSSLTVASGKLFAECQVPGRAAGRLPTGRGERLQRPARTLPGVPEGLVEHLLVANPDTSAETKLYLGAVSIRRPGRPARGRRLARIQGLQPVARRYVKSFPAVGHWLSLVPVLPFLDLLVELFCCWVMPDTFGRYAAADYDEERSLEPQFPFRLGRARGRRHAAGVRGAAR